MHSKDRSASSGSGFGHVVRRVLRMVMLLLVLLLVASIGLVIGRESTEAEPSAADLALRELSDTAQTLAGAAAVLDESSPSPDGARYATLAEMLQLHAVALRPAGRAAESSSAAASPTESSPPATPPVTPSPTGFLAGLTASYTRAFEAAAVVDAAPARVLASTATAQWLQSRALAESLGTTVPVIPVSEVNHDDGATPDCPTEPMLAPDPGLDGARTAVLAEQRAAYAYEVLAARAAEPAQLLRRMAEHENAAAVGSAILARNCVAEPLPSAAYALETRFLSEPDPALRDLEESLVGTYTDLVGVSAPGPVRKWAVRQLVETAQHIEIVDGAPAGGKPEAFPGIDPSQYPRLQEQDS